MVAVAGGLAHSLALKSDGSVLAWGCSSFDDGQCSVPAGAASGVVAIAAGAYHSLALKSNGSVIAWGCGSGFNHGQCTVPAAAASGISAIAAGTYHSLAIDETSAPTAVALQTFSTIRTRVGIRLSWRTTNEASIAGFNLYRSSHGTLTRLNRQLIPAEHAGSTSRSTYTWLDPSGGQGGKRTYELQTIAAGGTRTLAGTTTLG